VIFATPGIVLALLVITYPFVIRAVQPVLMEAEKGQEEAAYTLGASHMEVIWAVIFQYVLPKLIDAVRLVIGPAMVFLIAAEMQARHQVPEGRAHERTRHDVGREMLPRQDAHRTHACGERQASAPDVGLELRIGMTLAEGVGG